MAVYIVNKNADNNGRHEIHRKDYCNHLPEPKNQIILGDFSSCTTALAEAKKKWSSLKFDGCAYCCESCHTG